MNNLPIGRIVKYVCIPQTRGLIIRTMQDIEDYYSRGVINTMLVSGVSNTPIVFDGWVCYAINEYGVVQMR